MLSNTSAHRGRIALAAVALIPALFTALTFAQGSGKSARYSSDGQMIRPTGYRRWIFTGTPLTPNDMNNGKAPFPEFHNVYIDPISFAQWEKNGKFPDGTVIVKELVAVGTKSATSGKGYFMGEFTGLEVLVKDKQRFPKEPGNWAFFSFGHQYPLAEKAGAQPVESCSSCHGANAADDYVFTQYYPVLRAARPKR